MVGVCLGEKNTSVSLSTTFVKIKTAPDISKRAETPGSSATKRVSFIVHCLQNRNRDLEAKSDMATSAF